MAISFSILRMELLSLSAIEPYPLAPGNTDEYMSNRSSQRNAIFHMCPEGNTMIMFMDRLGE